MTTENIGTVKITSISLICGSQACEYMLRVYTMDKIESMHVKAIRKAWGESIFCRKRRIVILNNEIRIYLKKGDTEQKYIDCISGIIGRIKYCANVSRKLKLNRCKKHVILKRIQPSKFKLNQKAEHEVFLDIKRDGSSKF